MAEILAVPLKRTRAVNVSGPLTNLLAGRCTWEPNTERFDEAAHQLEKLRNDAVVQNVDKSEVSIELLARYCDQLQVLEHKIGSEDFFVPFKWNDAFYKGTLFSGEMTLTIPLLSYERTCSLFNLAALESQVAALQNLESDRGLRTAARLLQHAASLFSHLKSGASATWRRLPTPDLQTDVLAALTTLMLAQAQEMFVLKAISERVKDGAIAKLAAQCQELYAEASKLMQREPLRSLWDANWLLKLSAKQSAHKALAEFHQSRVCNANKSPGEEIARLQLAVEQFKMAASLFTQSQSSAQKLSREANQHLKYVEEAQQALSEARKLNDFVYLERVPNAMDLVQVARAPLAKVTHVPERLSTNFKDIFEDLPPMAVQKAMATWEIRRMQLITGETSKLRAATGQLNSILVSLNLPAAVEELEGDSLPPTLKRKVVEVRQSGGIRQIRTKLDEVGATAEGNRSILEEMERLLNEDEEIDERMKTQYQDRWIPLARADAITRELVSCRQMVSQAAERDHWIRNRFQAFIGPLEMVSQSESRIQLPPPDPAATDFARSSAANSLRQVMIRVDKLKVERSALQQELKSSTADIKSTLLQVWSTDGAIDEPHVSQEQLDRIFGPLRKRVDQSVELQASLLDEIRRFGDDLDKFEIMPTARHRQLKELAGAYEAYAETRENLNDGDEFHGRLRHRLLAIRAHLSDFRSTRQSERDELVKELNSPLAQLNERFAVLSGLLQTVGEKVRTVYLSPSSSSGP